MENIIEIINYNQIAKIDVYYKKVNRELIYIYEPKKILDKILKKIGLFKPYFKNRFYPDKEIINKDFIDQYLDNNNSYMEDNIVYYKPYLKIFLSNGIIENLFYENEEDMRAEINHIKNIIPALLIN